MDQLQAEKPVPLHDTDPWLMNQVLHCFPQISFQRMFHHLLGVVIILLHFLMIAVGSSLVDVDTERTHVGDVL